MTYRLAPIAGKADRVVRQQQEKGVYFSMEIDQIDPVGEEKEFKGAQIYVKWAGYPAYLCTVKKIAGLGLCLDSDALDLPPGDHFLFDRKGLDWWPAEHVKKEGFAALLLEYRFVACALVVNDADGVPQQQLFPVLGPGKKQGKKQRKSKHKEQATTKLAPINTRKP